jgi:hypothetical protein
MTATFWLKRFLLALVLATILLFAVELIKGHHLMMALEFALKWGVLSAGLYTLIGYLRFRRNPACWRR